MFYAVLPQYIGANQDMKIDINTKYYSILIAPTLNMFAAIDVGLNAALGTHP